MRIIIHVIFLSFIFLPVKLYGQSYWENYELFNTRNGLSNNAVLAIAQDNRGLLWIGTRNGLCIYDGYDFEVKKNIFNTGNEWDNAFYCVFKDRQNNIWVTTQTGKAGMFRTGNDDSLAIYTTEHFVWGEFISCIYEDKAGNIWMGSSSGNIYQAMPEGKRLIPRGTVTQDYIRSIEEKENGNFIINNYYTANLLRPRTDRGDIFYITINVDTLRFHAPGKTIAISDPDILSKRHYAISTTATGNYLLATSQLVKEYDAFGKLTERIEVRDDPNYSSEDIANCIFEDASGILWMGTNFGLVKLNREKYRFTKFVTNSTYGKLNSNYVRSIFIDKHHIWVGYRGGSPNLLIYDSSNKRYTSISGLYNAKLPIAGSINVFCKLRSGMLLTGGEAGLFYADIKNKKTLLFNPFPFKDQNNMQPELLEIWSMLEDRQGRLWVGSKVMGLYIIDPATHRARHYPYSTPLGTQKGLASVWKIFEDHKHDIWLGTENGLDSVILAPDGYPSGFYNIHDHYKGNAGRRVWSITEDRQLRFWFGTTDNGFSMLDKNNRAFITYNHTNGLPGDVTCGIVPDQKGYLWISTSNGLSKFDPVNHTTRNFTLNNGLPGDDFNFNACCAAPSGQLFFGTKSGMVAFYPDVITSKTYADIPVLIRTIDLWDKKYISDPDTAKPVYFKHNQNFFSFRFALPEYSSPSTHYFRYLLDGYDNQWVTLDARHPIATYTDVPPGAYTLHVKASVDGGKWSKPVRLQIVVQPAFWQHPFFRIVIIMVFISVVISVIYIRFNRSLASEREKSLLSQRFAELEFRALQAQMNPHFIFNSINAIQHFMFSNNEITANAYLSKFARLMRLYLESSNNKYIPLTEEIELLKLYVSLEKLRFDDKFDYTFSTDPYFDHSVIEIPSMLVQPYVENAINHGLALRTTKGMLHISFTRSEQYVICRIDDNGVGRAYAKTQKNDKQRKSRGMDMIGERLNAYRLVDNIEIKITITDKTGIDGSSDGTLVELFIPALV